MYECKNVLISLCLHLRGRLRIVCVGSYMGCSWNMYFYHDRYLTSMDDRCLLERNE